MQDVLFPALQRHFGKATESPGEHERLLGAEWLADAVFRRPVADRQDGALQPGQLRGRLGTDPQAVARPPLVVQRGYGAGHVQLQRRRRRCPTCGGSGFEHVEMQFLSDVYLRCQDCDGKALPRRDPRREIDRRVPGEVVRDLSIADGAGLTVSEGGAAVPRRPRGAAGLQPIVDVGLEYVKLGQPVPTLSGGEAQRLKLAGFLAEAQGAPAQAVAKKGTLYLFDEPTTGLHFDDIAKLMRAFRKLLEAGHSIVVIEHNLDVIRASDWLIDLGPEGWRRRRSGGLHRHAGGGEAPSLIAHRQGIGRVRACHRHRRAGWPRKASSTRSGACRSPSDQARGERAGRTPSASSTRASTTSSRSSWTSRVAASASSPACRVRARSTLGLRHPVQRRASGAISNRSTPMRAASCSRPGGRRWMRSAAFRPPSRSSSASRVAAAKHRWHDHRGLALPAPALREAGPAALHERRCAGAAAERRQHRGADPARSRGQHVGLMAPLVVARKGVYTDLAKWAARGHSHLRVDGEFHKVDPWPRLDRFKEHAGAAGRRPDRLRRQRGRAAHAAGPGAGDRQGRDACSRRWTA